MAGDRRLRILALLAQRTSSVSPATRLCQVCAEVTGVTGAAIMLMSGDGPLGTVCSTDAVSARVEELQYTLGEGPCVDAYRADHPVLEPDLADPAGQRWLAFSGPAVEAGARAVFGFPLHVGAIRLGALNLYRDRVGPLGDEQHADALVMAEVAAQAILMLQAEAPLGRLASDLSEIGGHAVVHQASGMMAVQMGVGLGDATVTLRAFAFSHDRSLSDVARDVVARTLRFEAPGGEKDRER